MIVNKTQGLSLLISVLVLSGCGGVQMGQGLNLATGGSVAGETSVNANTGLIRCSKTLGTLAVSDGRIEGASSVTTIDPLIRMAVQQSNCFVITSIGNRVIDDTVDYITKKQRHGGEHRVGSKQHPGQRVAADYLLNPHVIINNATTSGGQAGIGGLVNGLASGGLAGIIGGIAGAMQSNSTAVALTLTDIRSSVQMAMSEGSASVNNLSASMGGVAGGVGTLLGMGGAGVSGFTKTPEGQMTAAAFFDAYNKLVPALQNYKAQNVKGGLGTGGLLKVN